MNAKIRAILQGAAEEIRSQRRINEVLAAKVEVMDLFACVLHTRPVGRSGGVGEDIAWAIDHLLAEDALTEGEEQP